MSHEKTIALHRNENRFGTASSVLDVIKNLDPKLLSTYLIGTVPQEEDVISLLSKRYKIDKKNILFGYGIEDLLAVILFRGFNKGATILMPFPSWWHYNALIERAGLKCGEYPLLHLEDRFEYDHNAIEKAVAETQAEGLIICSPNNPTGSSYDLKNLQKLGTKFPNLKIFYDEAYEGFTGRGTESGALEFVESMPNLIVLRSFSKFFALAGLRIGWGAFGEKALGHLAPCFNRYLGFSRIALRIAVESMKEEAFYAKNALAVKEEREKYYAFFLKKKIRFYRSQANFILIELPTGSFEKLKSDLADSNIIVRYVTEKRLGNFVRITIGTPDENDLLISLLDKTL